MENRKIGVLEALFMVVVMLAVTLLQGVALSTLWGWFVVPLGFVAIPAIHFIGIIVFLGLVTLKNPREADSKAESVNYQWVRLLSTAMYSSVALLIGWLAFLLM